MVKIIFTLIAIAQGSFILGFTAFMFSYYLPRKKSQVKNKMRWHVMLISFSHILLTAATIYTSINGGYHWKSIWYWMIFLAYLFSDVSLLFLFQDISRREERNKLVNETD